MEQDIPKNWARTTIKEIAITQSGGTPSTIRADYWDGDIPWINSGKLKDKAIYEPSRFITQLGLKESSATLFPKNTVVIALTGATTGKVGYLDIETTTNQSITGIIPNHFFNSKFIFYQLMFLRGSILDNALGTAQPHINKAIVDETQIALAPLNEQIRISSKLDEIFEHLEFINEKLGRIPKLLEDFRQVLISQAITGKLTEKMRNESAFKNAYPVFFEGEMRQVKFTLPETWRWLPFSEIASVESNLVQPLDYLHLPLIAPDNIESGSGRLINKPLVSDIMPKSAKHYFKSGSIIYSKIRPYLSKVIIADFEGLCSADVYPIITTLNVKYLFYYLLSDVFLDYSTSAGERSVLPKINTKELNIIPVSVPPIEEQNEIVDKIEKHLNILEDIRIQYEKLKSKIEQFPHALLKKAFSGVLVSQDVNDESASELLKRVKIGKSIPIAGKTKKNKASKMMKTPKKILSLVETLKSMSDKNEFTFDEIKKLSNSSYLELKDELFSLLDNKALEMDFDEKDELMVYKLATNETSQDKT